MNAFRFAEPSWANLLWLVMALTAVVVWLELRRGQVLSQFISAAMQQRLVGRLSWSRRLLSIACLALALIAMVFALMRPQWGITFRSLPQVGAQIMICLDVSKSMLAEDTAPNRLGRAKAEIVDMLDLLAGEQVGLVVFAGKATVLCPMTPDFGFLKLVLDEAGPDSVGRGGTRLAEPIQKAVNGFREASDVSRVIMLITDGEDHDSFVMDAADVARERGIRVITIGFGDEAGSRIEVTDPESGLTSLVLDRDGQPVVSRLDGETLREIALKTEGAYIPAGTGALDLQTIYDQHIVPLVRGSLQASEQEIRNEAYQWVLLVGLLLLFLALLIGSGTAKTFMAPPRFVATCVVIIALLLSPNAFAQTTQSKRLKPVDDQQTSSSDSSEEDTVRDAANDEETNEVASHKYDDPQVSPREQYNRALAKLDTDLTQAESQFQEARRNAGADGEVRFRAAYNLGWVEVKRADKLLKSEPQQALEHLRAAVDWFRQAVRVRPGHEDTRHNLEVVMRRVVELADSLSQHEAGKVEERLDQLIEQQRSLLTNAGGLVERITADESADVDSEFLRRQFRQLAVQQRQALSEAQSVASDVHGELESTKGKDKSELKDEQRLRLGQLNAAQVYLQRAVQRMGQARSQLRLRQDKRAYRRASLSLTELKRARDWFRNPAEVIRIITTDATRLAQNTQRLANAEDSVALAGGENNSQPPAWLTKGLLEESQQSTTERTYELAQALKAALEAPQESNEKEDDKDDIAKTAENDLRAQRQRQLLQGAPSLLATAADSFTSAGQSITTDNLPEALEHQSEGIKQLADAAELFLDLRGLIEATYASERQIQQLLKLLPQLRDSRQKTTAVSAAVELQQKNLGRGLRLDDEVHFQLQELQKQTSAQPQGPQTPDTQTDPAAAETQRLELAHRLVTQVNEQMQSAETNLLVALNENTQSADERLAEQEQQKAETAEGENESELSDIEPDAKNDVSTEPTGPHPSLSVVTSGNAVQNVVEKLEDLRRLFFSITEHLRDTARRQSDLNDETQQHAGVSDDTTLPSLFAPLSERQTELRSIALQIRDALEQQAQQSAAAAGKDPQGTTPSPSHASEQFVQAARLVGDASQQMQTAEKHMQEDNVDFKQTRESQDAALQHLTEALTLLVPPDQRQNQQQQEQHDQQQDKSESEENQQQQQQNVASNQLLQMVRDREAQRRREKQKGRTRREAVEKDW